MNKQELVDQIAAKTGVSKSVAANTLNATIEIISDAITNGDKVTLVGFATFSRADRKATTAVNPKTKEKIDVPARRAARAKFSSSFNKSLN